MPNSQLYVRDTSNNKNVPLQVDSGNQLNVSDSSTHTSLSSISSTLAGSLTVSDTTAQASLSSIQSSVSGILTTSDSTAQSSLSNIESSVAGTLNVEDTITQKYLSNIDVILGGTISTSDNTAQSSLNNIDSKLSGVLATSEAVLSDKGGFGTQTVIVGDVSNNVDATGYRNCMVFGNLGTAGSIMIQVSNNNTEWYDDHTSEFFSNASSYHVAGRFQCITKHWRVKHNVAGSVEIRWAMQS